MENWKLKEAFEESALCGRRIRERDLAKILWPEDTLRNRQAKMCRLKLGGAKSVKPSQVVTICDTLRCSADFLFGRTRY